MICEQAYTMLAAVVCFRSNQPERVETDHAPLRPGAILLSRKGVSHGSIQPRHFFQ
jgi:hypothetical protein